MEPSVDITEENQVNQSSTVPVNASVGSAVIYKLDKVTAEPIVFLYFFGNNLTSVLTANLLLDRVSSQYNNIIFFTLNLS